MLAVPGLPASHPVGCSAAHRSTYSGFGAIRGSVVVIFLREVETHMAPNWSFSDEWAAHFDAGVTRTWDWDVQDRLEMFLTEIQMSPEDIRGLVILDAGCGNGFLTEAIASLGATVIGIDY
jgi:predicted TPR repeat methyltransferase